jgi:hypothetical protein
MIILEYLALITENEPLRTENETFKRAPWQQTLGYMECPVCYESKSLCNFTCGHSLCYSCTKSWYNKGTSTCPMCRGSMCFRGLLKLKKQWHREKCEDTYKNLVTYIFDELMEDYGDIALQCLEVVQNRYEYMMLKHPNISCEYLDIVLRMTWVDIDYLMKSPIENVYEPQTYRRYLFVNGTEYYVKNLSHTKHMLDIMSKDGKFNSSYATDRCQLG